MLTAPTETKCIKCKKDKASCFCRCCGFVCEECKANQSTKQQVSHEIISLDKLTEDVSNLISPLKMPLHCSKHPDKQLDLYCEACEQLICHDCLENVHTEHDYGFVDETFPRHREELLASLQPIEKQLDSVCKALEDVDVRCNEIIEQGNNIAKVIHQEIENLRKDLEDREKELVSQLEQICNRKLKKLANQQMELEMVAIQLKNCHDFVQESLRTGSKGEILSAKKPVVEQVRELTANFSAELMIPNEHANLLFDHGQNKEDRDVRQFGHISAHPVRPQKCYAMGAGKQVAVVGELATTVVHILDRKQKPYHYPVMVKCKLMSTDSSSQSTGGVKRIGENTYEVSYRPEHKGYHQLHIRVDGRHISQSPFTIAVITTTPTKSIENLQSPSGIAVNDKGEIVVAENTGHCVSIFAADGTKVRSFGEFGSSLGQMSFPHGLDLMANGDILVCEFMNKRIQQFSIEGEALKYAGMFDGSGQISDPNHTKRVHPLRRRGSTQFSGPRGVACHPTSHNVYIVDYGNHCIHILNTDLTFKRTFGHRGTGDGQFDNPFGVSFDSSGLVYVADHCNHRIQVFTEDGTYIRQFGKGGSEEGDLNGPCGIAIDCIDMVYISERYTHRVSLFTREGEFILAFGGSGDGAGEFNFPYGIAVDKNDTLYISDVNNSRVQVF